MLDTAKSFTSLVLQHYLETGAGGTLKELGTYAKLHQPPFDFQEAKVRHLYQQSADLTPGVRFTEEHRASHSRNYKGLVTGSHVVTVYYPTALLLRDVVSNALNLLRGLRQEATALLEQSLKVEYLDTDEVLSYLNAVAETQLDLNPEL